MLSFLKKTPYQFLLVLATPLFFSLGITLKNAYAISAGLLLLGGLIYFFSRKGKHYPTTSEDKWLYAVFLGYAFVAILVVMLHGDSLSQVDKPSRYIAIIPILYLIIRVSSPSSVLLYSLALGGIFLGIQAIVHLATQGLLIRMEGFTNAIQYGDIAMLISMFCLATLPHLRQQRSHLLFFLTLLGTLGAFTASIASGSRGGWLIAISSPIIIIAWYLIPNFSFKKIVLSGVLFLGASILLYTIPATGIQQRVNEAIGQVQQYHPDSQSANTSVGIRLELWRLSWLAFKEHPITGWGQQGYEQKMQDFVTTKQTVLPVDQFNHPHNDFFNEASKKGLIGILALLGIYAIPLTLFIKRYASANKTVRFYALLGVITVISTFIFGLTQAFLAHHNGIMYYLLCLAFFWGGLRHEEGQFLRKNSP